MSSVEKKQKGLTRRDFIKGTAAGVAGGLVVGTAGTALSAKKAQPKPWLPAKWDYEADVVVMGYGGAGSCAAIAAHNAGAKTLILEKDPIAHGGNTGVSAGSCRCPHASVEGAIDYLRAECWGTVKDESLLRAFVLALDGLPGWLENLGAKLRYAKNWARFPALPGSAALDNGKAFTIDVNGKPGMGKDLFAFLKSCVDAREIRVMLGTPVRELIQDAVTKEIVGLKATNPAGKEIVVKARRGVVMACGGFEANQDMLHQYLDASYSGFFPTRGTPFNTGDGIKMCYSVGADQWHMKNAEFYRKCCKPASELYGVAIEMIDTNGCIWANRFGKRFWDETMYFTHTKETIPIYHFTDDTKALKGRDFTDYQNMPFYMIFDETLRTQGPLHIWEGPGLSATGIAAAQKICAWSADNAAEIDKGWIIKADTIEELAKKIVVKNRFGQVVGMNPVGLVETVNKYNEYCVTGKDLEFGRRPKTMHPINKPPFYAMELCIGITNTNGGPVHNQYAQTLDVYGKPIPRLYSAGEFGSIFGFLYQGGQNVPEALSFGRIAGEHAASLKPWGAI